ncbi:MAG TPA: c-type cytochrome [Longimicrobiales bacterium]
MKFAIKCVLWAALAIPVGAALIVVFVLFSGVYDIAANDPHLGIVGRVLTTLQRNSVQRAARGIVAPSLDDPTLVRTGLIHYRNLCVVCHGSPGAERQVIGRGLNPSAPQLAVEISEWTDAELFWITRNGLKMAGMPAFSIALEDPEIWAVVAFMRRQVRLSRPEYEAMVRAIETGAPLPPEVDWVERADHGLRLMLTEGDAERGRRLLDTYGCGGCHVIPGLPGARGQVGPPLTDWGERHFIAGAVLNTPEELVAWIVNPQAIEPGTVMPTLGVTADEALDMAAYLFTLGERPQVLHTVRANLEP